MQELTLNAPTVVLLIIILALAALAIRRMTRRGLCDCGDHCGEGKGGCAGCSSCGSSALPGGADGELPLCCQAAADMAAAAEKSLGRTDASPSAVHP